MMKRIVTIVLLSCLSFVALIGGIVLTTTPGVHASSGSAGIVRFLDNSNKVLKTADVPNGYLLDIPEWTGFIPPLYRFAGWQTKDGIPATNEIISPLDFYPVMEKNFEYGDEINSYVIYQADSFNQNDLDRDFGQGSNWGYKLSPVDGLLAQINDNPFILKEFQILEMSIPYNVTNWIYFCLELNITLDKYIPTENQFYFNSKIYISLVSIGNRVYLLETTYGLQFPTMPSEQFSYVLSNSKILWSESFERFTSFTDNYLSGSPTSYFSFNLSMANSNIRWQLGYGHKDALNKWAENLNTVWNSDILKTGYQFDSNKADYCLGMAGLWLNRTREWVDKDNRYRQFMIPVLDMHGVSDYPKLTVSGKYAIIKKAIDCYIDGERAFIFHSSANSYERPVTPEHLVRVDETLEWYLDPGFTQKLLVQHFARDYNKLFGKWVPAVYEVVLQYWTLQRYYDSTNSKFFEVMVQKQVSHEYKKGESIDLNDFGQDQFAIKFYDSIPHFSFIRWDTDITKPITSDTIIKGIYNIPQATLYYYDVNNNLYGTVKQQFFLFPINELRAELDRIGPDWMGDKRDDGLLGGIKGFFDFLCKILVGEGNGEINEGKRDAERKHAASIIRQLAAHWSNDNQLFMPIIRPDINLEQLNKGAYGNSAFDVKTEKNPQWHLLSGFPQSNNLVYYIDLHGYYSLGTTANLNLVINFEKSMTSADKLSQEVANIFNWIGDFFGGIFGGFFGGLFSSFRSLIWIIIIIVILIFCWPLVVSLIKALFTIIIFPFKWLANKLESKS